MGMLELITLLSCKDGDELFEKVKELLSRVGIDVYNGDGSVKDVYTVICEVAKVMKKEE